MYNSNFHPFSLDRCTHTSISPSLKPMFYSRAKLSKQGNVARIDFGIIDARVSARCCRGMGLAGELRKDGVGVVLRNCLSKW